MHAIFSVFRILFFVLSAAVFAIGVGVVVILGSLFFLLFGKRGNFQIYTNRPANREPSPRPMMKDVTPQK